MIANYFFTIMFSKSLDYDRSFWWGLSVVDNILLLVGSFLMGMCLRYAPGFWSTTQILTKVAGIDVSAR